MLTPAELRARARRTLPRAVFDFVDGGADEEVTLRANEEAFRRHAFAPSVLTDVSRRDLSTTVCGVRLELPVLLAPTGLSGVVHPAGELGGALAAVRHGTQLVLSTASSYSLEEVTAGARAAPWFQLYPASGRTAMDALIGRAEEAGCAVLVVTVDCPVVGNRLRDVRNGMTIPPRLTPANVVDGLRHPRWLAGLVTGGRVTMKNLDPSAPAWRASSVAANAMQLLDPAMTWQDMAWMRRRWRGPLLVKGVLTPADARLAVEHGADGVVVSNHGGRQLDGVPATLDALPAVVAAVGDRVDVLLDGGVRRGSDVAKALALGARACLVGRPWLYGLAVGGVEGVDAVLGTLRSELDRTLALLGRRSVGDLDASALLRDPGPGAGPARPRPAAASPRTRAPWPVGTPPSRP